MIGEPADTKTFRIGLFGLDKLKEQNTGGNNPGVEGALDVDPDVIGALAAL